MLNVAPRYVAVTRASGTTYDVPGLRLVLKRADAARWLDITIDRPLISIAPPAAKHGTNGRPSELKEKIETGVDPHRRDRRAADHRRRARQQGHPEGNCAFVGGEGGGGAGGVVGAAVENRITISY